MRSEFVSCIVDVRAVEDCIRATKKYTKGMFSAPVRHPIQGEEFPSRVLTEYYEVYPDIEFSWDMPAGVPLQLVMDVLRWGDTTHIDVRFQYDYRNNTAKVIVRGGHGAVKELERGIPNFAAMLAVIIEKEAANATTDKAKLVDCSNRVGAGSLAHTQPVVNTAHHK